VAIGTRPRGHARMAEDARTGERGRVLVTGLAGVGAGEVVDGVAQLGARVDAVVAGRATGGDFRVGEGVRAAGMTGATGAAGRYRPVAVRQGAAGCRYPGRGAVAGIAGQRRRNMIGRLAGDADTVAGSASARPDFGMTETRALPGNGRAMALGARLRGQHMVGGLGATAETATLGVAKLALFGRALEDAAYMTGLTLLLRVGTGEREAGALVIEIAFVPFRSRGGCGEREQDQYQSDEGGQVVGGKIKHAAIPFCGFFHGEPSCRRCVFVVNVRMSLVISAASC